MKADTLVGPVLVTGGSGFIGKALCRALTARGETVIVYDIGTADARNEHPSLRHETGDIRDLDSLISAARRHGVNAIVHLAAMVIPGCRARPVLGAEVNVIGHINVMEAARQLGISKIVYTSSLAARSRGPLDSPLNLYGAYKQCCENISKIYFLDHGVNSIGLRPNVVYGPEREDGETAAITLAIKAAADGRPYTLPFGGEMCFQHIDEVTDIFMRCLAAAPERPVVSDVTTDVCSTEDLVAAIKAVVPEARIEIAPVRRAGPTQIDNTPLRELLGAWPAVSLEDGVRRTVEAFRSRR